MKRTLHIILFLLVSAMLFSGCTKKADRIAGATGAQGNPGTDGTYKGSDITGYVNLFDQYGNSDSSFGGVNVTTLFHDSVVAVTSNSEGKFDLPNLTLGNYDILFKKEGYDSLRLYVKHSGGDENKFLGIVQMNQGLTTKITSSSFAVVASNIPNDHYKLLQATINFDGPGMDARHVRDFDLYMSTVPSVSSTNFNVFTTTRGTDHITNSNQVIVNYYLSNIINSGFNYTHGDTVYVRTYIVPIGSMWTSWFNYSTYTNINYPYPGNSISSYFIWP